jgi:hypothetical protein
MKSRNLFFSLLCLALLFTVSTGLLAQGEFRVTVLDCKLRRQDDQGHHRAPAVSAPNLTHYRCSNFSQ